MVIWRLVDGKPGHEKQTLGLAQALLHNRAGTCFDLPVASRSSSLMQWLQGRFPIGAKLPVPDILIGAGHATHFALLAARRAYGGKAVVLMKPSLPLSWFDLCVIPEHDNPPARENVIPVCGVLNAVQPAATHSPEQGLMLIGGVSEHYHWDDAKIAAAVIAIAQLTPHIGWQLTTSRRTPATFLATLPQPCPSNLQLMPHDQTGPGWLERTLPQSSQVWVSEDSVSMLYEALTAGAGVGLLRLEARGEGRVRAGVEKLVAQRWVTPFAAWQPGTPLPAPLQPFNEANRISGLILQRFPDHDRH